MTPVLPGQGQEDEIQDPGVRAEQGIWRPVMLLHSGEPSLCRTHTPALPLSEIPEQSGGDVPVHLLPGAGVPPDHDRVPAQRVQGEGVAAGAGGCSDPCRHPVLVGFARTSCPLPFQGPQGLFTRLPGLQLLSPPPPAFITGAHCPATTLSLQPHWPPAVPSTGWCVPAFLGGHTLVFSSILLPGWERMGCCPALPSGRTR